MLEQTLIKVKNIAEPLERRPSDSNMKSVLTYLAGRTEREPTRKTALKSLIDSLDTPRSYRRRHGGIGTPGLTDSRNGTAVLITSSTKVSGHRKWMLANINAPLVDTACTSNDGSRAIKHAFPKLKQSMSV